MKKIRTIALKAREISEKRAKEAGFPRSLEGFCAIGATILYRSLVREGYRPKFGVSMKRPHVFIVVDDQIVDITASQYRNTARKKVHVINVDSLTKRSPYYIDKLLNSIDELVDFQRTVEWQQFQIPEKTYD